MRHYPGFKRDLNRQMARPCRPHAERMHSSHRKRGAAGFRNKSGM